MATTQIPAVSNELLRTLVKVFGLEGKRVISLTLKVEFNKFAYLTIERAILEPESEMLQEAIEKKIADVRFVEPAEISFQEA